ncbi:MAG: hypothetical protein NC250_03445 [Alistipes senegalensis]|nr:hypothetical protein [Bacteroides cellulosilyticus]MCM1351771.1 hypothetical protein [Alistipes senegalensis]
MTNRNGDDYASRGWLAVAVLIAVLVAVGFIPPQTVGGVRLRRANILSDILTFDDVSAAETAFVVDDEVVSIDMNSVSECIVAADSVPCAAQIVYEWYPLGRFVDTPGTDSAVVSVPFGERPVARRPDGVRLSPALVPIEDYGDRHMAAFFDTLLFAQRPVRIAFLGDSFVEGDILTADLRERLQVAYGGGGTGFAPMASPLTAYRRSVKTAARGWTSYNIMQRRNAPEALRDRFYVSGWVSQPVAGASTTWSCTDFRERLGECTEARIFFVSPSDSRVEVTVNDSLWRSFAIDGDPAVREIVVGAPRIGSLAFRVDEGQEGFVGYGVVFDGGGVSVDNYSVRSNNGRALFWTNPSVDAQMHSLLHYDLVILQYGLNIMQQGVRLYGKYGIQLEQMVAFVRECFPGAAVLLLGVSDRSVKTANGFEPMDAIPYMVACQRAAAQRSGAAFWPTSEAMRTWGGMAAFVANGWAAKDHTHINYAGGRRVAWSLADAIHAGARAAYEARKAEEARRAAENLLDSLQRSQIRQALLPDIVVAPLD